jgi:hypothetical protein
MLLHLIDAAEWTLDGAMSDVRGDNRTERDPEGEQPPGEP